MPAHSLRDRKLVIAKMESEEGNQEAGEGDKKMLIAEGEIIAQVCLMNAGGDREAPHR